MNNKYLLLIILSLVMACQSPAQTSKVFENLSVESKTLGMDRKFALYLPPDYDVSDRSYPVLYLLHGYGDDQTGWVQFGEVKRIADEAIRNGSAAPMIIVMPDANTQRIGYFNDVVGNWRYEDFFFDELMPHVEKKWRIKSEKRFRAISGLSMGGGGTLVYALHRPELFSSACPLSAWFGELSFERFKSSLRNGDRNASESALEKHYKYHNPLELFQSLSLKDLQSVRWYFDCGDDDFLFEGNSLAHIALTKKKVPHEYRVRDGGHTWTYWRASLPEVLRFVSDGFHQ
ncbi:MAG: alpha/beta hydrolase-fold protein [Bacteroidota bacterium]